MLAISKGCGWVSRAVASDTRGPWFESSIWQNLIVNIFNTNCYKDQITKKAISEVYKSKFRNLANF